MVLTLFAVLQSEMSRCVYLSSNEAELAAAAISCEANNRRDAENSLFVVCKSLYRRCAASLDEGDEDTAELMMMMMLLLLLSSSRGAAEGEAGLA